MLGKTSGYYYSLPRAQGKWGNYEVSLRPQNCHTGLLFAAGFGRAILGQAGQCVRPDNHTKLGPERQLCQNNRWRNTIGDNGQHIGGANLQECFLHDGVGGKAGAYYPQVFGQYSPALGTNRYGAVSGLFLDFIAEVL